MSKQAGKEKNMGLLDRLRKSKKWDFMEAIAAACAMVASADGIVRPEETAKLIDYIRIDENLKVFDSLEVIEAFERYIETFEFDFRVGKEKAFKTIRQIGRGSEDAKLLILVCCAIGDADGDFDNDQRLAVREICRELGLNPDRFDLDLKAPSRADFPKAFEKAKKDLKNMPDWMRNPPKKPKAPDKKKNMPDWMRNPPEVPRKPSEDVPLPDWMRDPPEIRLPPEKKDNMPDWMRHPPKKPKSGDEDNNIPEWMKEKDDK